MIFSTFNFDVGKIWSIMCDVVSGPILEFKGSIQYAHKGHANMVTQAAMILQNGWVFKY